MKKLTPKETLFCKFYLSNGFNATQAAISAGYSKNCPRQLATRLLSKAHIRRYLDKRMAEIEKKLDITFEQKMELLWKTAQRCYGPSDEDIEKLRIGEEVLKTFEFQPSSLVSTIAELNKMQGHHAPQKTESKLDDDQFKKLLKECEQEY